MILQKYKIVFAGNMGAGKTEAIQSISEIPVLSTEAFNTDLSSHQKMLTTVGIDYGEITIEQDVKVGLYGTPGQSRFDFMWSVICDNSLGIILLIDHSLENSLEELDHYFSTFQKLGENIAIGITHVDDNKDKPTYIYRDWLKQHQLLTPLFFIDAREKEDVLLLVESVIANAEVNLIF
ncbi:GTP-binding protein [Acinetobacter sp. MB5]|uniref:GTP-binding protein n=1 Tax=Acinetobacter sp. MB5 TaxID=2069438 RepID=UPI000DD01BFB|nr:ATP/GTP-binding protein [Acinetobacter sp. MB5]